MTDKGLVRLTSLENLESLDVAFTPNVTDAGVAELRKSMPKLRIAGREAP